MLENILYNRSYFICDIFLMYKYLPQMNIQMDIHMMEDQIGKENHTNLELRGCCS